MNPFQIVSSTLQLESTMLGTVVALMPYPGDFDPSDNIGHYVERHIVARFTHNQPKARKLRELINERFHWPNAT